MYTPKAYPVEFYRSRWTRKHRWRITADNGRIIAASTQGYWNKSAAENNLRSVQASAEEWEAAEFPNET